MRKSSEFQNYPFLTGEEFAEACHHLDRRYCQATLGPVRRKWKLRTCNVLNTAFGLGPEYNTYVQIVRPLEGELDDGDLSNIFDSLSFQSSNPTATDDMVDNKMVEAEDADEVRSTALEPCFVLTLSQAVFHKKPKSTASAGQVVYEIHLHPTYQVPCLWFSLHNLPVDEQAFNIDTVFRRLVPDQYKDGLRSAGEIGGISADVCLFFIMLSRIWLTRRFCV